LNTSQLTPSSGETHLTRALGLPECITITAGSVIGVGLFTVGSAQVGIMGSSIILATIAAFLLVLWPAAMYGEMGGALPYAGGTYAYAKRAINYPTAVFCSWNYTIAQIGIAGGEALAFASYFKWLCISLGFNYTFDDRIAAIVLLALFGYINYKGIEFTGKVQNAFMYFFWAMSLIWFVVIIQDVDFANFIPLMQGVPHEFSVFAKVTIMVWWCFAGFETLVGMGGEVKFPQINIPRALVIAPFIVFSVNALFQWFLCGLTPLEFQSALATDSAPYATSLSLAGIVGFPLILLCIGITFGGDLGTMNPCIAGPSRYMYVMAKDGCFPQIFAKLHSKYKNPYIAVITVGIVSSLLILTGSIALIASMCAFSQMICYIIGFISYLRLKKNEPNLKRHYIVPAGKFGAYFSIITYTVLMIMAIDMDALPYNITLCVICLLYYFLYVRNRPVPKDPTEEFRSSLTVPTLEEKHALDSQWKHWKYGAFTVFFIAISMYIIAIIL
jgi:APA family basic amino acid/polyamine antiporter